MKLKLSLLFTCVLIVACQVQPTTSPPPPTTEVVTPSVPAVTAQPTLNATRTPTSKIPIAAAELRGIKLNLWHPLGGEQAKALKSIMEDFNQNNIWGIQVTATSLYSLSALEEQVLFAARENKLPQVVLAPPEVIADWGAKLKVIVGLSPFIEDGEWGLAAKERIDFYNLNWQSNRERFSLPLQRNAAVLFYNQTFAQELGFSTPPATPEEFRLQACAASKKSLNDDTYDNDGQGGWFLERDPLTLLSWLEAFNAQTFQSQSGQIRFNSSPNAETFTYLRKLLDSACAWVSKTSTAAEAFAQRRAILYSGSLENLLAQERIQALAKSTDRWSLLPYPATTASPTILTSTTDGAILTSRPVEQLASWLLLRWLLLPRSQVTWASAAATLPVRSSAFESMSDFARAHPQWATVAKNQSAMKTPPQSPEWRLARRILEDAAWQIFQPYVPITRIPTILLEMDSTLEELLKRQP